MRTSAAIDGPAAPIGRAATVRGALVRARASLEPASGTARLDAEILLAQALGWSRARLHAHPAAALDVRSARRFEALLERRRAGEPIAYLTGRREFWSLDLLVTPDTLIPRPETEHLVEAVLAAVRPDETAAIADIGTGTGAVAIAVALERPRAFVLGSDRSPAAVAVARTNAARLGAGNVSFVVADACAALAPGRWSVIVSNPPYVAEGDPHLLGGDVRFEPREALVSGPRGLDMLETLARHAPRRLAHGGRLVLEHGAGQGPEVRALLSRAGFMPVETFRDLAGNGRVTLGRRAPAGDDRVRARAPSGDGPLDAHREEVDGGRVRTRAPGQGSPEVGTNGSSGPRSGSSMPEDRPSPCDLPVGRPMTATLAWSCAPGTPR